MKSLFIPLAYCSVLVDSRNWLERNWVSNITFISVKLNIISLNKITRGERQRVLSVTEQIGRMTKNPVRFMWALVRFMWALVRFMWALVRFMWALAKNTMGLTFCSEVLVRCCNLCVMLDKLCSNAATTWAWKYTRETTQYKNMWKPDN